MAKANKTAVAQATAPVFPTAEQMHATTQAILNAPPKGVNWEGFEAELTDAFVKQAQADESLRTLAGKMFQCGFRFAHLNNEKGEMDDKTPHYVELRKRLTKRLSEREQVLLSMDKWNAAALDVVEKAIRTTARKRLDKMMSLIRKHLKTVEEIETNRARKTLEQRLYDKCTEIRKMIVDADPNQVKFDVEETKRLIEELREHFNI
jgi:membrane-associated HD superfamily phosphohydrolase